MSKALRAGCAILALGGLMACAGPRPLSPGPRPGAGDEASAAQPEARPTKPAPDPSSGQPQAAAADDGPELARFDGRSISAAEFARWLVRSRPQEALASLSRMVGEEIAAREAAAIGLRLPPDFGLKRARNLRDELEREAALAYGVGTTVDRYCRLRFSESERTHLTRRIAAEAQRWMFSRLIRYRALRAGRVHLSAIHLQRLEDARDVVRRLGEGASFAKLADRHSLHESGRQGGKLPPTSIKALHPAVASRVRRMQVGEVSGVLEIRREGSASRFQIVRLEDREPPREGSWPELQQAVESDLERRPLDVLEWTAWYLEMEALYSVRLAATFDRS